MTKVSVDQVLRWIVSPVDPTALENWIGNKELYPEVIPQTVMEIEWEQAYAIEEIRRRREEIKDQIAKTNTFVDIDWASEISQLRKICRNDNEILSVILDGWQPEEISLIGDLATVIGPVGIMAPNAKIAAEITVDSGLSTTQKLIILSGDMVLIPTEPGQKLKLKIKLNRDLRLSKKTSLIVEVTGGRLGVVIDVRGRPVPLPGQDELSKKRVKQWREIIWGQTK